MTDYIDRKALQKELNDWYDYHYPTASGATDRLHMDINQIVKNMPSVDAVEQRHGHWIKTVYSGYKCEICGHIEDVVDEFEQPLYEDFADFCETNRYCRICGAKMRGLKDIKVGGDSE